MVLWTNNIIIELAGVKLPTLKIAGVLSVYLTPWSNSSNFSFRAVGSKGKVVLLFGLGRGMDFYTKKGSATFG
jgi:hypothetical protein